MDNQKTPPSTCDAPEIDNNLTVRTMKQLREWATRNKFASQLVIEVPVSYRNIKKKQGIGSVSRETKHFTGTTTMHGPKRIFFGKGISRYFWMIIVTLALSMLIFQIVVLLRMYFSRPILSQVSFIVNEGGMDFPAVTSCNFNPIKRSYIKEMNKSQDLTGETLEYLLQTNADTMFLFSNLNRQNLSRIHNQASEYFKNHTDFKIIKFLRSAGYNCPEMFKACYFGGRRFDCCKYMKPKITSLGNCYQLDLQQMGLEWMKKQTAPGAEAGLQVIADAHLEEELRGKDGDADAIFSYVYENGFRYFIHPPNTNPELVSEGISVSPSRVVYSALKTTAHTLLDIDNWGNCTNSWPAGYNTWLPYSSTACRYLCLAQHFLEKCGCAPFTYNIDGEKTICAPYEIVTCMDEFMTKNENGTEVLDLPECSECHMECESVLYNAYNSYGDGFNQGSLDWIRRLENRTEAEVRKNTAIINIFFLEMFYTSYAQVKAISLTEVLSDIGGNMGMFLGMSVITITELSLFFSKVFWIMVSKRRRDYMYSKKKTEQEKEQQIEEAVKEFQERRSRRNSRDNLGSISNNKVSPMYLDTVGGGGGGAQNFGYKNSSSSSLSSFESMIEIRLDANELRKKLSEQHPNDGTMLRLRLSDDISSRPPRIDEDLPVFVVEPPTVKNSACSQFS